MNILKNKLVYELQKLNIKDKRIDDESVGRPTTSIEARHWILQLMQSTGTFQCGPFGNVFNLIGLITNVLLHRKMP